MKDFNLRHLAEIGRIENGVFQLNYAAAIPVYFLMGAAITFFVLPKLTNDGLLTSALWGGLMGFIVYGVFDLTNLAILKNYSLLFAAADVAWGSFVFAISTIITKKIGG